MSNQELRAAAEIVVRRVLPAIYGLLVEYRILHVGTIGGTVRVDATVRQHNLLMNSVDHFSVWEPRTFEFPLDALD